MNHYEIGQIPTEMLLETKIADFKLTLPAPYMASIKQIEFQLKSKGIKWKPYFWLSDEWFVPDGIAGIAIPFVLCHPRLVQIEKQFLGFCEGEKLSDFKKLYSHEIGHAIDNAFYLRLKKTRQKLFGRTSLPYPKTYSPVPNDDRFVKHLDDFYAQAHPDEDWAETFAVWLNTKSWKIKYRDTQAIKKLEYVDEVIQKTCSSSFAKLSLSTPGLYLNDQRTLREYLKDKKRMLGINRRSFFKPVMTTEFSLKNSKIPVQRFIKIHEKEIIHKLQTKRRDPWVVKKCLNDLSRESQKQAYFIKFNSNTSKNRIVSLIDKHYDEYIKKGRTKVFM